MKISVCVATFNGEKYIKEQLESIICQLKENDEIIISDDNSKDKTLEIVKNFEDKRIKIFYNNGKGVLENFQTALLNASGDYFFLSDQDDIWDSEKVNQCLIDFEKGYDLVLTDCSVFNSETGEILHDSFFQFNNSKKGFLRNIIKNSYVGCCIAFNKDVKDRILPFPKNVPMHDSWIGLVCELHFKIKFNPNKLVRYRKHSANASDTGSGKSKYSFIKKVSFRLELIYSLFINNLRF